MYIERERCIVAAAPAFGDSENNVLSVDVLCCYVLICCVLGGSENTAFWVYVVYVYVFDTLPYVLCV